MTLPTIRRGIDVPGMTALRRLGSDTRGVTAVEFAMVVVPFVALIVLAMEMALVFWIGATLDNALQNSMRQLYVGSASTSGGSLVSTIHREICEGAQGLVNCQNLKVDVAAHSAFGEVKVVSPVDPDTREWRANFGGQHGCPARGSVVVVHAALAQQSFYRLDSVRTTFKDGSRLIQAAAVVQLNQNPAGGAGC
jgi:Flp pilus assembly protein TadG